MFALRPLTRLSPPRTIRLLSTLPDNPDIYIHPTSTASTYLLSLLPTPTASLSLGTTTALPPTPRTFTENPRILPLLQRLLSQHAAHDPTVQSDAQAFASSGGTALFRPHSTGAGAANVQGGAGGAGVGGWVHVYDMRGVPSFGRIAETEDIFGSLLVDANGSVVNGTWEPNRNYRIVTGQGGMMRLSGFLRERVREGLVEEEGMEGT